MAAGAGPGPEIGCTGARFGEVARRRRTAEPHPEPDPGAPRRSVPFVTVSQSSHSAIESGALYLDRVSSSSVRPYVFTRGRTRSQFEISIEALVSVVPLAPITHVSGEQLAVIDLCREPRSVAEIAALLGVPLGVARVLVGDLVAAGAVAVHRTADAAGPDMALMERVLAGLHRL